MVTKQKTGLTRGKAFWAVVNSPIVILLISGGVMAGVAKYYNDSQLEAADLETRRTAYVELLAEYQRRVSSLGQVDGELDRFIGEGVTFTGGRQVPESGPVRDAWENLATDVGRRELDILRGTGNYVPTTPEFASVDLLTLAARIERTGGIPDIQLGGIRMLGALDAPAEALWLFVRAYMPILIKFGVTRHLLYTNGGLPLPRGAKLTKRQEAVLGFPNPKPGDLEKLQRENDILHAKIQETLGSLEGDGSSPGNSTPER